MTDNDTSLKAESRIPRRVRKAQRKADALDRVIRYVKSHGGVVRNAASAMSLAAMMLDQAAINRMAASSHQKGLARDLSVGLAKQPIWWATHYRRTATERGRYLP